jgi:hypothetical protein
MGLGSTAGAKARQASKLAEIREALVAAGCNTAAKQAAVLGVSRPTAWVVLNRDKRVGPSAIVIKRILSSPDLPRAVRRKVEEYVEERIRGLYGHSQQSMRSFREQFRSHAQPEMKTEAKALATLLQ